MRLAHDEGEHGCPLGRGADATHAGRVGDRRLGVGEQFAFAGVDALHAQRAQPVARRGQADRLGDRRGAGLEAGGRRGEGGAREGDPFDHLAAAAPRRHGVEHGGLRIEHADAGRAVELVRREGEEVAVERRHVDRPVRHRLRRIDQHPGADGVRLARQLGHRIDRAQRVGDVDQRHQLDPPVEQAVEGVEVQRAIVKQRARHQFGAGQLSGDLPGHDVGMVLHAGDQHAITGLEVGTAPAPRDQVDRVGAAHGEDDLLRGGGAKEAGDGGARFLVQGGRAHAALVQTAVHRAVLAAQEAIHAFDDGERLLGGGGAVEVDERLAVRRALQAGELGADRRDFAG